MSFVYDDRLCTLGEGPLWHPARNQLFWFDITGKRLLTRHAEHQDEWAFDECVSAAGWVDETRLLMASETGLWQFDLVTGRRDLVVALEADNPLTRSNDGRADPWGGFWIGTMGKSAQARAGAIYRYYRGDLRLLMPNVSISNSICFAPDQSVAYFSDTPTRRIMRQRLRPKDGWPEGDAEVFVDLTAEELNPDGAVVDADGVIWVAQWGAGRVAAYDDTGRFLGAQDVPGVHSTCPAFGGENLGMLFCTSARQGITSQALTQEPRNGMTFACHDVAKGQPEHKVIL